MKALMLAFGFALPYHVLRCASAAGAKVSVLGNGSAELLRYSRHCARFHRSRFDCKSEDYKVIAAEVADVVESSNVDIVFPTDDVSTRLLIILREALGIHTTPLPSLEQFDTLNDKWNFSCYCQDIGVRVPATSLYQMPQELIRDIETGRLALPLTIKPTDQSGSRGVQHILGSADLGVIQSIDYAPLLVQQHIKGKTVGISVLCDHGRVVAHNIQYYDLEEYRVFRNDDLRENVDRLAEAVGLHGMAFFDAVIDAESGLAYLVECNPRFWYSVYLCMLAGLNFLDLSLHFEQVKMLEEVIADAAVAGQIRPLAAEPAAFTILEMIRGLIVQRVFGWSRQSSANDVDFLFDMIWKGLAGCTES